MSGATSHVRVRRSDIDGLVQRLFDPDRDRPVVIVSRASDTGQPRVDPGLLDGRFDGELAVLADTATSDALSQSISDTFRVFGGAIRVVQPGAARTDTGYGHPLFFTYPEDDPHDTAAAVLAAVSTRREPPTRPPSPPQDQSLPAAAPTAAAEPGSDVDSSGCGCAEQHAAEIRALRDERATEVRDLRERLAAAEATPLWPPVVHDDPEDQFRYTIEQLWLLTHSPAERAEHPLRPYRLGPAFLDSLTTDIVPTRKATEVCLDIITQRVWATRTCHVATRSGGGSPAWTRNDGRDTAYRAYIKADTPGAPRLLWWYCADGTIELAAAAHHDDFSAL